MRPSAARTSSSPHNNIHPLLTDDDSDDENKRLDAELHKDLVNSLNSIDEKEVIKVIRWKLDNNEFIQTENHQLKLTKKEV